MSTHRPLYFLAPVLATAAAALCLSTNQAAAHPTESNIRIVTPLAEVQGTLLMPHVHEKLPCVDILGGDLSQDRDGRLFDKNAPPRDALKRLAEALDGGGYASFRFDRVGYGQSKPRGKWTGTYSDEAAVAAAVIERIRKDGRFDKVIVAGEGAGAYIACLAAKAGTEADGYIFLGAELTTRPDEMFRHIKAPLLALAGEHDRNVPSRHAARIAEVATAAGNKDAAHEILAGLDHSFQEAPADEDLQVREKHDKTSFRRPYSAKPYHTMLAWLGKRFRSPVEPYAEQIEQAASRPTPEDSTNK